MRDYKDFQPVNDLPARMVSMARQSYDFLQKSAKSQKIINARKIVAEGVNAQDIIYE